MSTSLRNVSIAEAASEGPSSEVAFDRPAHQRAVWAARTPEQRRSVSEKISLAHAAGALVDDPAQKRCRSCGQAQVRDNFYPDARNNDGLQGRCKACWNSALKAKREADPGRILHFRRRRYGIRFEQLWDQQNGQCALCGLAMRLQGQHADSVCVDHDHSCCPTVAKSCGKCVRGLIHANCNRMLGQAKDNPDLLRLGAEYLRRWEQLK